METSLRRMFSFRPWVAPVVTLLGFSSWAQGAIEDETPNPSSDDPSDAPARFSEDSEDTQDAPNQVSGLTDVDPAADSLTLDSESASDAAASRAEQEEPPQPNPSGPEDLRQASPVPRKVVGDQATGFAKRTIGPMGIMTFNGPEGTHGGGALQVRGVALLYGPVVSARYLESHWIGYDTFGTTYSLRAQMGIGGRWEFSPNHGPFVRADVRAETTRMGGFRYSSLRFPGIQLGYGLDQGKWILDAFGHAGISLTGRMRHPGFTRHVRGAFVGGAFSLGYDNWLLHSDVSHLLQSEGSFWDVRSSLCSYWGRKPTLLARTRRVAENVGPRSTDYSVGFCTDFGSLSFPGDDEIIQKTEVGLSIVFGSFSRLDHAGRP